MNSFKFRFVCFYVLAFTLIFSCNIEPFEGDVLEEQIILTCDEATQNSIEASIVYSNTSPIDSAFENVCKTYKEAIMNQIALCGDEGGVLNSLIESLGDCGNNNQSEGDYWPMAINNSWDYSSKINNLPQDDSSVKISGIEDYQGSSNYYYDNFLGTAQGTDGTGLANVSLKYYSRNDNGDYYVSVGEMTAELSGLYKITQTAYDYVVLKDYLNIGATWSETFDVTTSYESLNNNSPALPSLKTNYKIDCEILDKNISITVGGNIYNSVIKVGFNQTTTLENFPASNAVVEYIYYFAQDVGIVKIEGTVFDADDNISSTVLQELTSYSLN